jgi:hypothetical protein
MFRLAWCVAVLAISLAIAAADDQTSEIYNNLEQPTKVIRKIHIDALDAFDPKIPEYRSWPFRFLNKLHNRTNDGFIRRELIFREGDRYDEDITRECERLLRQNNFLDNVRIESKPITSQLVDLYVHTEDQWTLQFNVSAGATKGVSTYEFSVEEANFLGLGKTIGMGYNKNTERKTYNVLYFDPQFLNSRWKLQTNFENNSDGWRYINDFLHPFYSLDTKWAYGMAWDSGTFTEKLHYKGKAVAEIDTDHRTGLFFTARSWGARYDKLKVGAVFATDSVLYPHPARINSPEATTVKSIRKNLIPLDREGFQYGGIVDWDRQRFIEQTYLDNFGRVEDLPVGMNYGTLISYASNTNDFPDYLQVESLIQYSQELNKSNYYTLMALVSGRRNEDGIVDNLIFNAYAHYYSKLPGFNVGKLNFPRQTLAANISATLTNDVDAPFQLSLGEDEGLRGYTFKSFTGQNRLLMNVEDRIFTPLDFRLFAIGLAAFFDAGYVWSSEENLKFDDFGTSVGIGLRIGLKKSRSAKVVRVDLAFPLGKGANGFTEPDKKGYSISFSSGHIFSIIGDIPKLFQLF